MFTTIVSIAFVLLTTSSADRVENLESCDHVILPADQGPDMPRVKLDHDTFFCTESLLLDFLPGYENSIGITDLTSEECLQYMLDVWSVDDVEQLVITYDSEVCWGFLHPFIPDPEVTGCLDDDNVEMVCMKFIPSDVNRLCPRPVVGHAVRVRESTEIQ
eukprot:GHVH01013036.1.p1 GENE.GHVH01013036.1~~GHVH01013036.1.p1  ORF type:complete len:160 (+),score=18.78 GHVH01013036.1:139-618(+)